MKFLSNIIDHSKRLVKSVFNTIKNIFDDFKEKCKTARDGFLHAINHLPFALKGQKGKAQRKHHQDEWPKAEVSLTYAGKQESSVQHEPKTTTMRTKKTQALPQKERFGNQTVSDNRLALIPYQPNPFLQRAPIKIEYSKPIAQLFQKLSPLRNFFKPAHFNNQMAIIPYSNNPLLLPHIKNESDTILALTQKNILRTLNSQTAKNSEKMETESVDSDDENDIYYDAQSSFDDDDLSSLSDEENEVYYDAESEEDVKDNEQPEVLYDVTQSQDQSAESLETRDRDLNQVSPLTKHSILSHKGTLPSDNASFSVEKPRVIKIQA